MNKELIKRFLSSIIILPIAVWFIINGSVFFIFFLSILFLVTSYEWIKMSKKKFLIKILGIIFLLLSFYSTFQLRNHAGLNFFLFIVLICIFTDIGGYIFGKFFKGPKLTKISPNKTYSGVIGSFILPVLAGLIYTNLLTKSFYIIESLNFSHINNNIDLKFLFFILLISITSQVGDLIISYFKRLAKVKDTGKILPGHGGLLDRLDGLIFVIPILYLFIIL
jgi:phosphatidate cytidylyltransferase